VVAVALFGATIFAMRVVAASQRVIGWVLAAAAITGLLHPYVALLARRIPRGLAVLIVGVCAVASATAVTYAVAGGIVNEYHEIQRAAPARAAQLEATGRFSRAARDAHLAERVKRFVDGAPLRLQGGTPTDALRAAATRGVAFLATGILALFFLLDAPSMGRAALAQFHRPDQRQRAERIATAALRRAFGYARGTLAMAMLAGLVGWAVATRAHVPGPAPFGLWMALWDVVPLIGASIGAVPIVALAAIDSPSRGAVVALFFVAYQLFEWLFLQRWIERRTLRMGPFATIVAAFAGLELYGVGGALIILLAVAVVIAALDEVLPPAELSEQSGAVAATVEIGPVGPVDTVGPDGAGDGARPAERLADEA
jgi:predicted PurR-regulated permease PerM